MSLLFSRRRPPASSTLFPYTTLFRSRLEDSAAVMQHEEARRVPGNAGAERERMRRVEVDGQDSPRDLRSEEHTSELQSPCNLVCRLLLEKKKKNEIVL